MRADPSTQLERTSARRRECERAPRQPTQRTDIMTASTAQRLATALPLVGAALLLASIFLPVHFAAVGWLLGVACFLAALTLALVARRRREPEPARRRDPGPALRRVPIADAKVTAR